LLSDDKLQQEWSLLKKTQLDPAETILFPGINSLYRHEKGRLVIGKFARWAVAAALIAGGFFIGITLRNKQSIDATELAGNDSIKAGTKQVDNNNGLANETKKQSKVETVELPTVVEKENIAAENNYQAEQLPTINKNKINQPVKSLDMIATNPKKQPGEKAVVEDEFAPGIEPVLKGHDIAKINKPLVNEAANNTPLIASGPKAGIQRDTNIQPVENLFAKHASVEADEENSDDHIFMMEEEKLSRTKAAGFLKKIKRTVERTTKIKPGSLKIAGFEFAVK
jgi:hypothetical protein